MERKRRKTMSYYNDYDVKVINESLKEENYYSLTYLEDEYCGDGYCPEWHEIRFSSEEEAIETYKSILRDTGFEREKYEHKKLQQIDYFYRFYPSKKDCQIFFVQSQKIKDLSNDDKLSCFNEGAQQYLNHLKSEEEREELRKKNEKMKEEENERNLYESLKKKFEKEEK